jgi:hypothetical protein
MKNIKNMLKNGRIFWIERKKMNISRYMAPNGLNFFAYLTLTLSDIQLLIQCITFFLVSIFVLYKYILNI